MELVSLLTTALMLLYKVRKMLFVGYTTYINNYTMWNYQLHIINEDLYE